MAGGTSKTTTTKQKGDTNSPGSIAHSRQRRESGNKESSSAVQSSDRQGQKRKKRESQGRITAKPKAAKKSKKAASVPEEMVDVERESEEEEKDEEETPDDFDEDEEEEDEKDAEEATEDEEESPLKKAKKPTTPSKGKAKDTNIRESNDVEDSPVPAPSSNLSRLQRKIQEMQQKRSRKGRKSKEQEGTPLDLGDYGILDSPYKDVSGKKDPLGEAIKGYLELIWYKIKFPYRGDKPASLGENYLLNELVKLFPSVPKEDYYLMWEYLGSYMNSMLQRRTRSHANCLAKGFFSPEGIFEGEDKPDGAKSRALFAERHKDKIDKLGRKDKDFFFAIMRTAPLPTIGIDCPKWDPRNTKSLSKIMTISDEAFIYCEIHALILQTGEHEEQVGVPIAQRGRSSDQYISRFQTYVAAIRKHRAEEAAAILEALKAGRDPPTTWDTEVTTWLKAQLSGASTNPSQQPDQPDGVEVTTYRGLVVAEDDNGDEEDE